MPIQYRHRVATSVLQRYLSAFPVIGITGPRQSGKSTFLQHTLKNYRYVTFDDVRNIDFFESDPVGFMREYSNQVIFDEVQYVPEIFQAIKLAVDQDRQHYGKFVLTGSSQFAALKNVSESLAGRIGLMTLLPFQYSEVPKHLRQASIYQGSYPELVDRNYTESSFWYSAYFDTYLNKDVRQLSSIGNMSDFRRFIRLLAANVSHVLDLSHYANDLGVSVPTVKRWISILEASYVIFLLPPYFKNYGKRIIKRPKLYFYDTGLVSYLIGITTEKEFENGPMAGAIFENYVVSEILKKEQHAKTNSELFFLRSSDKKEVDLIVDRKQYKELIEIKKSSTFKSAMLDSIKLFLDPKDRGYLLYFGEDFPYTDQIRILNYQNYLGDVVSD